LAAAGIRPRLFAPVTFAALGRLKDRELTNALNHVEFRAQEIEAITTVEDRASKVTAALAGRKTASPGDAYAFLEKAPGDLLAFILAESSNSKAVGKIRTYLTKWKPLRQALPAAVLELETMGLEHGPKFDKVIEDLFQAQLAGKARNPELRIKLLRKLSGIKEAPKKKVEEKKKPEKSSKKKPEAPAPRSAAIQPGRVEQSAADALARLKAARKGKVATAPPPAAPATKPANKPKAAASRKR